MSSLRWRARLGGGLAATATVAVALITVGCSDSEGTASSASGSSPTPPSPTTIVTPPPPASIGDRSCGVAWGPDGILDIVALTPGVDCADAKRAADTYMSSVDGFMTSNPLEVGGGWTCRISLKDRGEIVRCTAGQQEVSLNRRTVQVGPGAGTDADTLSPIS
ncbi:MAG: hypothetical protein V7706_19035 [Dietzia psychralcaliphila]